MAETRLERVMRLVRLGETTPADSGWKSLRIEGRPVHDRDHWIRIDPNTTIIGRFDHSIRRSGIRGEAEALNVMVWRNKKWRSLHPELIKMIELALWPHV